MLLPPLGEQGLLDPIPKVLDDPDEMGNPGTSQSY